MVEEQEDFLRSSVPITARRSSVSVLMVWMGFIIVVGIMTVGGGLASQMSMANLIWAVMIGNVILSIFALIAGLTGAHSGKSFSLLLFDTFPGISGKLASLYVPVVLIGWYGIEASIFGHLLGAAFHSGPGVEKGLIVLFAFIFAISSYVGFGLMTYTAFILVPIIIGLGIFAILQTSSSATATFGFGADHIGLSAGIAIVVGTWIMGAVTCMQDMTRFAKSPAAGAWIAAVGILVANSFTLLIGASGAALAKQADPAALLLTLGLIWPAIVFSLANIWTTNDSNMYSASLNLANFLGIGRRKAVLVCTVLGAAFAATEPYKLGFLFQWLIWLGNTAPALGAAVLADYWLVSRSGLRSKSAVPGWVAWIGGSALSFIAKSDWSFLIGMMAGVVLYVLTAKAIGWQFARSRRESMA